MSTAPAATVTPTAAVTPTPTPVPPAPVATGSVTAGKAYWNLICTTCHGLAPTSVAINATPSKIRTAVNGKMDGRRGFLRGVITDTEIADVSACSASGL